jgi:hypothetical protein
MLFSGFEIARPVEIANQPRLRRLPPQLLPRALARGPVVDRGEMREPAEVVGCSARVLLTTRTSRRRPITPAMSQNGTPSAQASVSRQRASTADQMEVSTKHECNLAQ